MALAQDGDDRVLQFLAAATTGALGQEFRPLAAEVTQGRTRPVEPVRVDSLVAALPGQVSRCDLRADPGNGVVEVDQPALVIRQADPGRSRRGRVGHVSHGSILGMEWCAAPSVGVQGSATAHAFLFQGADAILGGTAGVAGAAGVGFTEGAATPRSDGR